MDPQQTGVDEAELIEHSVLGDDSAWEQLMRAHQEAVFRYAYLLLGDPDEAEDIAQETFIRAHRSLNRFDLSRPLRPWLLKITANLSSNRRRSLGRYWHAVKRFARLSPEAVDGEEWGHFSDSDRKSLWSAIQDLSPPDREILYLRYFLEMSIQDTALTLRIKPGTVKSRASRALDRLRKRIEEAYPELL